MSDPVPFGVANNNPLNIRPGDPWEGVTGTYNSPRSGNFLIFKSAPFGFRAAAVTLQTYYDKYKLDTIRKIISRWAPPGDHNDTDAYINSVSTTTGFGPDEPINPKAYADAWKLIRAMTIVEVGSFDKYFKKWQLDDGLRRAGVSDAPKPALTTNITAVGGAATTAAGVAATYQPVVDAVRENIPLITAIAGFFHAHPITGIAIGFGVICVVAEVVRANRTA
jgi:hypothetical protein